MPSPTGLRKKPKRKPKPAVPSTPPPRSNHQPNPGQQGRGDFGENMKNGKLRFSGVLGCPGNWYYEVHPPLPNGDTIPMSFAKRQRCRDALALAKSKGVRYAGWSNRTPEEIMSGFGLEAVDGGWHASISGYDGAVVHVTRRGREFVCHYRTTTETSVAQRPKDWQALCLSLVASINAAVAECGASAYWHVAPGHNFVCTARQEWRFGKPEHCRCGNRAVEKCDVCGCCRECCVKGVM